MSTTKPHAAASFHHSYLEAIRHRTAPAQVIAEIIVNRLRQQGIDGTKNFDYIKRSVSHALTSGTHDELKNFHLDLDNGNSDSSRIPLEIDSDDIDQAVKKIEDSIESASQEMFASFSESALKSVLKSPSERLLHETNERDAFVRRLEFTWAQAFRLLDVQISLCIEIGAARNDWLRKKRRRSKDRVVVDVITRLHGRAASVAGEVQALLRNGFADGALSRWRTMHELTVTAMFVAQYGPDVAERFAAHVHADSIKAARQYQNFASILGFRQISAKEQSDLDATARELEQQYGKCFLGDYGWAAEALRNPRPTFASIEASVDLDRLRPYVKLASNTVHASAKGTFFRLGVQNGSDAILAGASNFGLDEAGRLVALSLSQITSVLLMLHPNTDSIVWCRVLNALSSKVEKQFIKIQRRIEREERQFRPSHRT